MKAAADRPTAQPTDPADKLTREGLKWAGQKEYTELKASKIYEVGWRDQWAARWPHLGSMLHLKECPEPHLKKPSAQPSMGVNK